MKRYFGRAFIRSALGFPELTVKSVLSSVNVNVGFRIHRFQIVANTVDCETSVGNAICETSDDGAEDATFQSVVQSGVGKGDISQLAFAVRGLKGNKQGSVFGNPNACAMLICQGKKRHLSAVGHFSPDF